MSVGRVYEGFKNWYCPDHSKKYYWLFAGVELSARAARPMKRAKRAIIVFGVAFFIFIIPPLLMPSYEDVFTSIFVIFSPFPMVYVAGGYFLDKLLLDRMNICEK